LTVQALSAQLGEDHVDSLCCELVDPDAAESGDDELPQHALIFVDRGRVQPFFDSQLLNQSAARAATVECVLMWEYIDCSFLTRAGSASS